ncbi:MAG TPA: MATE family efflux transporter [Tepidimicrobium sp.]|nr:MATE family efflux transporter [Tepidimicrobium sp.]
MDNREIVEGNITSALIKLAIPIMATSFVQMAYSMMDMIWLGRLSTNAVAAAGTAGFFTWLGSALFMIPKIGAEVGVAQSYGKKDMESVKKYAAHTLQLAIIISILYSLILIFFRHPIIGFFNLGDQEVINMAIDYLFIVSIGMGFYFLNPVFSGILNGSGDSTTPFKVNALGLIINMILDPLMIMGIGPFPRMEVKGAALATIIAQIMVTFIFIFVSRDNADLFCGLNILKVPDRYYIKRIFKLGFPSALQTGLFASIAMIITRILSRWGSVPIGVQNVGSQIESISWLTAGGFSTAISVFIGQNHGAKHWDRIREGYRKGLMIVGAIGIFATLLLIGGAKPIFRLFIPRDREAIEMGVVYLKILGLSQFFMAIEIGTQGAFNGLGKTIPPSFVGILFNSLRIPSSLFLSSTTLGLDGVWWSISISSIFKGVVLFLWYIIILRRLPSNGE